VVARVNQAYVEPANIPAAMEYVKNVLAPAERDQEGFRGVFLITREDGYGMVIDFYDTEEQARSTEESGWYQQTAELFSDKLKGQVRRNFYTVTIGQPLDVSNVDVVPQS
jgi:hypothetical protein